MTEIKKPSFCEIYLKDFKTNNPHCEISVEEDKLILNQPWGTDDTRLVFDISDLDFIKDLNNIMFKNQFDAIIHSDKNVVEFFYAFLPIDEEPHKTYLDRSFECHFEGKSYKCYFSRPTDRLFKIAEGVRRMPSDSGRTVVPQLKAFRDIQRIDKLPNGIKKYFEGREPRNFFLKTEDGDLLDIDLADIARHINFISGYYDRMSPIIVVREDEYFSKNENVKPNRFIEKSFPNSVSVRRIDDIILRLIEVARASPNRFAFLYYYQVFEYAGFYFVDEKAKRSLRTFLKDPSMINCADEKINLLFSMLSELNHNDDVKMRKIIEEYCDPLIIWSEIENDKEFFSSKTEFEGGFELSSLVSADTTSSSWKAMWMPKLYDHLTKIRNCLVHARERRQSKVILPTMANNRKIQRYIPIMKRLAEQIAIYSI